MLGAIDGGGAALAHALEETKAGDTAAGEVFLAHGSGAKLTFALEPRQVTTYGWKWCLPPLCCWSPVWPGSQGRPRTRWPWPAIRRTLRGMWRSVRRASRRSAQPRRIASSRRPPTRTKTTRRPRATSRLPRWGPVESAAACWRLVRARPLSEPACLAPPQLTIGPRCATSPPCPGGWRSVWRGSRRTRLVRSNCCVGRPSPRPPRGLPSAPRRWGAGGGAGAHGRAGGAGLAWVDTAGARRLGFMALAGADTTEAGLALDLMGSGSLARSQVEHRAVAQALERRAPYPEVARWFARIVASGDSSASALLAWGAALERAGGRTEALRVLALASRAPGASDAATAEFELARITLRRGRTAAGVAGLAAFARRHPDHRSVPLAVMVIAETRAQAGARRAADSLYQLVVRDWPDSPSADEARLRVAARGA